MPKPYVPVEVSNAIGVIEDFLNDKNRVTKSVSQPREWDSYYSAADRVRYHKGCSNYVKRELLEILQYSI